MTRKVKETPRELVYEGTGGRLRVAHATLGRGFVVETHGHPLLSAKQTRKVALWLDIAAAELERTRDDT